MGVILYITETFGISNFFCKVFQGRYLFKEFFLMILCFHFFHKKSYRVGSRSSTSHCSADLTLECVCSLLPPPPPNVRETPYSSSPSLVEGQDSGVIPCHILYIVY